MSGVENFPWFIKARSKILLSTYILKHQPEKAASRYAAEDGRKRASTLPPLEREPTFQRKPKHFNPYEGTSEEAGDSHWNKSYEKVSIEVNNKVKTHLKRQLLQRFERRLRRMEEAMAGEDGERHGRDYHPWDGKGNRKRPESKTYSASIPRQERVVTLSDERTRRAVNHFRKS